MSATVAPQRFTASALGRRNPTVKLVLLFMVSLVTMFVFDPFTPALLYVIVLMAVVASARIPARILVLAHIPFVGFAFSLLLVNALSRPGEVVLDVVGLSVTVEGLAVGASLAFRTMVIGTLSIAFVASTDGVGLMTSLHQHAGLGARVTYAILAGYRMLQEMPHEWRLIRHAHAVRAPLRSNGQPSSGWRVFGRAAFSLLVVSLRKGERMAESLESRGLGLPERSTWRPVPLGRADWVFAVAVLAALVLVLVASASLGYLEGFDALSN